MVGDIPPTLDREEVIAVLTQEVLAHQHIGRIGVEPHREDGIVLAEEEEGLRRAVLVLGLQLSIKELFLQRPRIGISDTPHITIAVGLFSSGERKDLRPRNFVHLDILLVVGGLQVGREHFLQLMVRRCVVREMRQKCELWADSKLGQESLHIHHRLMARMRTLIAQGIDDQQLRTTNLRPFLCLDRLHIGDIAHRPNAVAHDRQRAVCQ